MTKKKDWKALTTAQLMDEVEKTSNDDDWGEIFDALISRTPFEGIYEQMQELQNQIETLEQENKKLSELMRSHAHLENKVMIQA